MKTIIHVFGDKQDHISEDIDKFCSAIIQTNYRLHRTRAQNIELPKSEIQMSETQG